MANPVEEADESYLRGAQRDRGVNIRAKRTLEAGVTLEYMYSGVCLRTCALTRRGGVGRLAAHGECARSTGEGRDSQGNACPSTCVSYLPRPGRVEGRSPGSFLSPLLQFAIDGQG